MEGGGELVEATAKLAALEFAPSSFSVQTDVPRASNQGGLKILNSEVACPVSRHWPRLLSEAREQQDHDMLCNLMN